MTQFTDALIRQDVGAALALMVDDVVLFYSNGTTLSGKEAFATTMSVNWQLISNYKYQTHDALWVAESFNAAAVAYGFSWTATADGKQIGASGRATRVFRRQPGSWLLAHEHLSLGSR